MKYSHHSLLVAASCIYTNCTCQCLTPQVQTLRPTQNFLLTSFQYLMSGSVPSKIAKLHQLCDEEDPARASAIMVTRGTSSSYSVHTTAVCTVRFMTYMVAQKAYDANVFSIIKLKRFSHQCQALQHATCNMQHATCNMQHATCNMQHAT